MSRLPLFWCLIAFFSLKAAAAPLQCAYVPQLFEIYLKYHYAHKTLSDDIKAHTTEQFIKNLDPSKTMFLEKDVDGLRSNLPNVFTTMKGGNCLALEDARKLSATRAQENLDFVKTFLEKNYKLDENTKFVLDPRKRGYPKSPEEKQDIMKKMVHFQISNYLLADMKLAEAKKNLVHRYELIVKRLKDQKMS